MKRMPVSMKSSKRIMIGYSKEKKIKVTYIYGVSNMFTITIFLYFYFYELDFGFYIGEYYIMN